LEGWYGEIFNSDAEIYGGSNLGNLGGRFTDPWPMHSYAHSLDLCLPPLSTVIFRHNHHGPDDGEGGAVATGETTPGTDQER
ncbi:MAG: hypothetical protein F4Y52_06305, partial [Synechococcus sp. SB0664_bin_36]|nr:hypothetical protein [Synechococcus sp. SB0664_bin_36]